MSVQKIEFNDANFDAEIRMGLSVVCFEDPRDLECRQEAALVEKAAGAIEEPIKLGNCDIENCPKLAKRFRITTIPTILIIKDGQEMERLAGFRHKKALIKHLKKHVGEDL